MALKLGNGALFSGPFASTVLHRDQGLLRGGMQGNVSEQPASVYMRAVNMDFTNNKRTLGTRFVDGNETSNPVYRKFHITN